MPTSSESEPYLYPPRRHARRGESCRGSKNALLWQVGIAHNHTLKTHTPDQTDIPPSLSQAGPSRVSPRVVYQPKSHGRSSAESSDLHHQQMRPRAARYESAANALRAQRGKSFLYNAGRQVSGNWPLQDMDTPMCTSRRRYPRGPLTVHNLPKPIDMCPGIQAPNSGWDESWTL